MVSPSAMRPAFAPPPASGTRLDANAALTPGSASMRRTTSSTRRVIASAVAYASPAMYTRIVISRVVSTPASAL